MRLSKILPLVLLCAFISSCKKELSEPHLIDPIYLDLMKEHGALENKIKSEERALEVSLKEFVKSEPHTIDRKIKAREIERGRENIQKYTQLSEYYRINADLRRAYGRKDYLLSFQKNEPWPKKHDVDAYFKSKELRHAPRKWSVRVPGSANYDAKRSGPKGLPKDGQHDQVSQTGH